MERCRECGGRRIAYASARAAIAYDDTAKRVVSAWKERGLRTLAKTAAEIVTGTLRRPRAYTLTFVPADPVRGLERGYNPARLLAEALGSQWDLPAVPLLDRRPGVGPQRGLSLVERRKNVRGVFHARQPSPSRVVLVDDVYTSGATVSAAASALCKAGARHVDVVTFARAVR